jgi:hypothetical protein
MAAADDRTFVVDTLPVKGEINPVEPRTWYLLRLAPGTGAAAQLSRLPLPSLSYITALALSRSGDELAIASGGAEALGTVGKLAPGVLRLYSVATGKLLRTWTSTDQSAFDADGIAGENTQDLTWIDDDRGIAFLSAAGHLGTAPARQKLTETLHVLDVNAPGDSLLGDSRVVWSQTTTQAADLGPTICSWEADVLVSADGKTIVCPSVSVSAAVAGKGERWTLRWLAYSTSAPTVASTLFTVTINQASSAAPVIYSQWIGGKTIIADWYLYNDGMSGEPHIGVVSNGHFTPLPVPVLSLPGLNEPGIAW